MPTTLVTGGAGFIGSHFVELLFARCPDERIIVLDAFTYAAHPDNIPAAIADSGRFRLLQGDIRDPDMVEFAVAQADRVVHFAAESHVTRSIADDRAFFETDVMGTHTIAAAVARNRARIRRFVHISTSEVYGTSIGGAMDENHPLNPCTPYAAAKAGADRLVYAYEVTYGLPVVIIRPFNNYGPRQHLEKCVPRFITAALDGQPLTVHGTGRASRDWLHVTDCCEGIFRALAAPDETVVGQVINLGTGTHTSVREIAARICEHTGRDRSLVTHTSERPGQVDCHLANIDKARRLLDWQPRVKLADGLAVTVRWYDENRAWWAGQKQFAEISVSDPVRRLHGSY